MSFRALLNHIVRVYREPDPLTARDDMGNVVSVHEPIGPAPRVRNARPHQRWMGDLRDPGPGEEQTRLRTWFLHKDLDVQERDVLLVIAGEETGSKWRVVSLVPVQTRRSLHHKEANCESWSGPLGS